MRLKLKKEDLNKGLQAVQKVAQNKNNNMSSENGLLIKALHGIIEFQANDYDMGIKITVPGIIEEKGEAFIANPYLMDLTRRIPSDEIEIIKADTDTQLLIKGDKLKFECLTINPDDFNEVEIVENGYASFKTTSVVLKDLIDNTSYACATDVARPIFMGTFLDVQGDQMTMVATDTHRLALKKTTLDEPVNNPLQAVIPSRLLSEISRQLKILAKELKVPVPSKSQPSATTWPFSSATSTSVRASSKGTSPITAASSRRTLNVLPKSIAPNFQALWNELPS